MKAVVLEQFGDVNNLQLENVDEPAVGAGEVRVRVHATSINPIDWKIRSGAVRGRIELPAILGATWPAKSTKSARVSPASEKASVSWLSPTEPMPNSQRRRPMFWLRYLTS